MTNEKPAVVAEDEVLNERRRIGEVEEERRRSEKLWQRLDGVEKDCGVVRAQGASLLARCDTLDQAVLGCTQIANIRRRLLYLDWLRGDLDLLSQQADHVKPD